MSEPVKLIEQLITRSADAQLDEARQVRVALQLSRGELFNQAAHCGKYPAARETLIALAELIDRAAVVWDQRLRSIERQQAATP